MGFPLINADYHILGKYHVRTTLRIPYFHSLLGRGKESAETGLPLSHD